METLLISFLSGFLTILAPCVLSLLPVIIGGSIEGSSKSRPLFIVGSLSVSVIIFSLLLKGTTAFISIPNSFWATFSGTLVFLYGLSLIYPNAWQTIAHKLKLNKPEQKIQENVNQTSTKSSIILGASLGPVFTSCSPTYALILAIILPANTTLAVTSLIAFALGMSIPLLAIGYGGQKVVKKLKFLANPNGKFKKILALLLIISGLLIMSGLDKKLEAYLIKKGFVGTFEFEQKLIDDKL